LARRDAATERQGRAAERIPLFSGCNKRSCRLSRRLLTRLIYRLGQRSSRRAKRFVRVHRGGRRPPSRFVERRKLAVRGRHRVLRRDARFSRTPRRTQP